MRTSTSGLNSQATDSHTLQTFVPVTQPQADFLELIRSHGYQDFSRSLKLVHDIALYHSDVNFEETEKTALFDLKVLWEGFDELQQAV